MIHFYRILSVFFGRYVHNVALLIGFCAMLFFGMNNNVASAQKEANVWHFGNGQGFDFNSGQAVQIRGVRPIVIHLEIYCSIQMEEVGFLQLVRIQG
jgi:hypothetical protein